MTDNDIIKAFEDKVNLIGSMTSVYLDEEDGFELYEVLTSVLDLINRKNAEIEELQKDGETIAVALIKAKAEIENKKAECLKCGEKSSKCIETLQNTVAEQKAEIERLRRNNGERVDFLSKLIKAEKQKGKLLARMAETEAIKEFAERIKKKSKKRVSDIYGARVYIQDIDDTKKEMVGDVE